MKQRDLIMDVTCLIPVYNKKIPIMKICSDVFLTQDRMNAFDEHVIGFFDVVSQHILKSPNVRMYPELISLAYWLRKGNIIKIISDFQKTIDDNKEVVVPRGIALHIAPSNVESIFLYSWALSLLAGNINIVRVSQSQSEQTNLLFDTIRECVQFKGYKEIGRKNIILTYQHNEELNAFLSARSDVRVLWGGDETISAIRSLSAKPTTKDISFADKYSYCIIKASEYLKLDVEKSAEIGRLFVNDAYWFDQMACSSPRIVYFVGSSSECLEARQNFWRTVAEGLHMRQMSDTMSVAMNKLIFLYEAVIEDVSLLGNTTFEYDKPAVVRIADIDRDRLPSAHCGGGFFWECFIEKLFDLSSAIHRKDQTLTYFGFEKSELKEFVLSVRGKGIDRVVPIGQAMDFSPIWDGYVLLNELTKRVSLLL